MKRATISIAVSVLLILFSACNPGMQDPVDIKGSLSTKDFDVFMEEHQTVEELATFFDKYPKAPEYMKDDIRKAIIEKLDNRPYDTIRQIQANMADSRVAKKIDTLLWSHEDYAWQFAIERNDIVSYEKYLEMYPGGEHFKQIQDKMQPLINRETNALINAAISTYLKSTIMSNTLESLAPIKSEPTSAVSYLSITNDSKKTCTVYLRKKSGHVEIIRLTPHKSCKQTIANGKYDLVVISDDEETIPWACQLKAQGSYFELPLETTSHILHFGESKSTTSDIARRQKELNQVQINKRIKNK